MSAAAAVLAIVVAAGEARNPATANLLATAEESLGPGTSIRLFEVAEPSEAEALRVERELGAGATVTVVWQEPAHLHALLRVHLARTNRWTTRAIVFSAGDSLAERGRTLGLAVASMWPETAAERPRASPNDDVARPPPTMPPPTAPPPTRPPPTAPPATMPPPTAPPTTQPPSLAGPPPPLRLAALPTTPVTASRPQAAVAPRRFEIGVSIVGALGVGGPATGLGAAAEGILLLTERVSLRLGTSVRSGPIPELPGSDLVLALGAGVEWWLLPARPGRSGGLGIRLDAVGLRHQVRTNVAAGQAETQGRFLPGADLAIETTLRVASRLNLVVALGSEVAFGTTDIREGNEPVIVATIPAVRAIAQAGLRLEF